MTLYIRCTHVNSYPTALDPPSRQSSDHRALISPTCVTSDQITVAICPTPLEHDPESDVYAREFPFIEFCIRPAQARQLAFALLEEADAADVKALKQAAERILVN